MIIIKEDAEPACKYCVYRIQGGYCINPESPHFTEPMLADEGCSWISQTKDGET